VEISFLTPLAGILALSAIVPLAVLLGRERRAREIRAALSLAPPSRAGRASVALTLGLVPALLGLAATQPVLDTTRTRSERTDAQAFFVLDTSRSMLASAGPRTDTRLERARQAASALQQALPEIPVGLAVLNEVVLPFAFPTTDSRVIDAVLADSIGIEGAQPQSLSATFVRPQLTTSFGALAAIPRANYFPPSAERRLLVVFTDGESTPISPALARPFQQRRPGIETIFVRFFAESERIYVTGVAEPAYVPNPALTARLDQVGSLVGGRVFSEGELGEVRSAAEDFFGSGPTRARPFEGERLALMPYVTLAAFVPLAFLLWRRNL
jgi:von Willebrand factor type A domain